LLVVIDQETIADFAVKALSTYEYQRSKFMGEKRLKSYLAARLALKYLSRKLSGNDKTTPASEIHTMMKDHVRPCCPVLDGERGVLCSVSHDRRFVIAVADDKEIGVDVETISDRILKVQKGYMNKKEMALTEVSPLGIVEASIRVWSIKEGASKAIDIPLEKAWKQVSVDEIGETRSMLDVEGVRYQAWHDTVDDHIFTLVSKEG